MEGQCIAGKYRLARLLGKGGMGSVWLAEHLSLRTPVAIKLIDVEAAKNAGARARFDREAQLAARIRSAHVVKVLDHGLTDDGLPYIAMECLAGETLRDRLSARGRITLAETAKVVSHVCRALARAHEAGLVHRDIKPENIFMAREDDGEIVKILDFGVAKATDALSMAGVDPTRTGALLGTPYYMSPEQAKGLKSVDYRSDLWSLGIVVFECLTGQRPFTAPALGPLIAKILGTPAPALSAAAPSARVPAEVEAWMRKALAVDPDARFASARELAEAFMVASGTADSMERGPSAGLPGARSPSAAGSRAGAWDTADTVALAPSGAPPPAAATLPAAAATLAVAAVTPPAVAPPAAAAPRAPAGPAAAPGAVAAAAPAVRGLIWAVVVLGIALLAVGGVLAATLLR
ncbi:MULTISPECIES: serine/threonine-protein kinase [Sorangium]|uniref:Protein kinase n=1 Tax=Sorangium cellulosum TaxID=56 RepID=A0A4P2QIJ0_SORCE|nr:MULTISPECIES: serine/threonine-protein kinase [Sorangium]AUX29173.1 protein kinase [Sorangium cellulosum]WCQ88565.1 serine-threonine kinase [Sorangium sp. Soce836]